MVREFLELVFPRECAVCGQLLEIDRQWLCDRCMEQMPLTYFWKWRDNPAEEMLWGRTYLQGVISLYFYSRDNEFCELVHKVKYGNNIKLGRHLGQMLGEFIAHSGYPFPDYIVPVPIHWRRRYRRGYNQAGIIAEGLQDGLAGLEEDEPPHRIPILSDLLRRCRYTSSQVNMTMGNKWENAHGTFALRRHGAAMWIFSKFPILRKFMREPMSAERLRGKHIFLVDDVLTSGATAQACYDVLRVIPDIRITLVTLAFVKR